MLPQALAVLFATAFQVISSQEPHIPPECRRPPEGVTERPHECCKIPELFETADFEECGFEKLGDFIKPHERRGPPDCSKQLCIMKKKKLSTDNGTIDHEAVNKFVDTWTEANPDFKDAVNSAKESCIGKPLPGPPHMCEADKIFVCISTKLIEECPKWEESEGCQKIKAHIQTCSQYFRRFIPPPPPKQ